jgi:L-fucose isomerase-like protein
MAMKRVKIGLVGTYRLDFTGDYVGQYKRSISEMENLSKEFNFDLHVIKEGLVTSGDAQKAANELEEKKVDIVMLCVSCFPDGEIVIPLSKIKNTFLGLWAVPEPYISGVLPLNSFVGINMFGSIIGEYLINEDHKFKWFFGNTEDELFIDRFKITLKAVKAIINLKGSKIAWIGGNAPHYYNQYFDERKILSKFGVKVESNCTIDEIENRMKSYTNSVVKKIGEEIISEASYVSDAAKIAIDTNARLYLSLEDYMKENNFDALSLSCWPRLPGMLNMAVCSTVGRLNDKGIVTACEGDVVGTVSMLLLKFIGNKETMFMDLSLFDEKDDSILFWHCGPAAKCYANKDGLRLDQHFIMTDSTSKSGKRKGTVGDMIFKPQPVTVMRPNQDCERMFVFTGNFMDTEKESFDGSRGWMGNLKLNDEKISARDLMNTIMVQRIQHHYPIIAGHFENEIKEIAAWLDMDIVERKPYKPYFQNFR